MIVLDLCLSDIPESARKKSDKNGKWYTSLVVDDRKEPGKFGETHTLAVNQSKEERQAKTPKAYVGSGKEYKFEGKTQQVPQQYSAPAQDDDDLPF